MDRAKVIKGLECHKIDNNHRINCADCPYYVDDDNHIRCVNDLHDDAIVLLKEQEAKPVKILFDTPGGGEWIHYGDCPNCGKRLDSRHNSVACGRCGQVVKWE